MWRSHYAAFLNSIVKKCKSSSCTVTSAYFKSHFFKNMCNTIADCRCRCKWKVNDTKRNAKSFACFFCYKLTHSCDFKCGFLNHIGDFGNIFAFAARSKSSSYYARSRNTDIDNGISLADTVESSCHKRVIFRSVTEYYKLCSADAITVCCSLSSLNYSFTHHFDCIHINTGFSWTDIYRRANKIGSCKCFGDTLYKRIVTACETFLYKSGITADEVYAEFFCGFVECVSKFYYLFTLAWCSYHCDRGNWNSLIYNRNTVLPLDILACFYEVFGRTADFVVYLCAGFINIIINTV